MRVSIVQRVPDCMFSIIRAVNLFICVVKVFVDVEPML